MDDLVQFLRARLDEDERIAARAVNPASDCPASPKWDALLESAKRGWEIFTDQRRLVVASVGELDARHIARHDPARVLAEVDAKRRLLAMHEEATRTVQQPPTAERRMAARVEQFVLEEAFRAFAVVSADHPDYREEWRPA